MPVFLGGGSLRVLAILVDIIPIDTHERNRRSHIEKITDWIKFDRPDPKNTFIFHHVHWPIIVFVCNEARPNDSCLINNEIEEKVVYGQAEVAIEFSIFHQFDSFGIAITAKLFFQECLNQATFSKYLTCLCQIDGIR
jgi:hypothetical protein